MHTFQHQMLRPFDASTPLLCRRAPGQEHHTSRALRHDRINHLLCKAFPALVCMGVGLVRTNGQARVQEQHSAVGPGGEQATVFRRGREVGVVVGEGLVDVLQGGRGGSGWAHGETEAVGLVEVVVGVLAYDDGFDGAERRVSGPGNC